MKIATALWVNRSSNCLSHCKKFRARGNILDVAARKNQRSQLARLYMAYF
jgi:hypothetical protein